MDNIKSRIKKIDKLIKYYQSKIILLWDDIENINYNIEALDYDEDDIKNFIKYKKQIVKKENKIEIYHNKINNLRRLTESQIRKLNYSEFMKLVEKIM